MEVERIERIGRMESLLRRLSRPSRRHYTGCATMRWILPTHPDARLLARMADDLRVPDFVAELLLRRGFVDSGPASAFLHPRLRDLADPFLLPDMERAVARVLAAVDARQRIVLYGDYDVDGVTSIALLHAVLGALGVVPETFLPDRMEEGYGLSRNGVERCLRECRPELVIAVDCGTSSAAEIARIREQGIGVVVLDHHECKELLPDCDAVVNPKRTGEFAYLCSVGVAFKLAHAMLKRRPVEGFDLRDHLDLVAVGTVADLVPMVDENRILAAAGMQRLARTTRVGLRELMTVAGVRPPVRPGDIGFRIGPRLNAAGRLGTARAALELLLTTDPSRARTLAAGLELQNRERQAVERATLHEAEAGIAAGFDATRDAAIVVGGRGWHQGVIGIVASRLMRTHHRPTFVVGFEDGMGRGSGRSVEGLSLVGALTSIAGLLETFGGHEMAAGLTLREERFPEFADAFRRVARESLTDDQLVPTLQLDAELSLADVDESFLEEHDRLQPFGSANPQPIFFARGVRPAVAPRVMKERHLLFEFEQDRCRSRAVFFGGAASDLPRPPWDIAFRIERNEFKGVVEPQVQVQHIRGAQ